MFSLPPLAHELIVLAIVGVFCLIKYARSA